MGRQSVIADRDAQPTSDIEYSEQQPIQPGVVVKISVERDPDHRTHGNCAKKYDGPGRAAPPNDWVGGIYGSDGDHWCLWNHLLLCCLGHRSSYIQGMGVLASMR